jgi:molybdopterin-containing oxidoreductase family iron-sulfur binding subunit
MANDKKYWVGLEELHDTQEFKIAAENEFAADKSVDEFIAESGDSDSPTSRRDFLKFLGFGVTAATIAACETPVIKSIPYAIKPEEITPGIPNYYASTYYDGNDYGSILVKTREGRPIFIKPNKSVGQGINARINTSVLSLYDSTRLRGPLAEKAPISWDEVDQQIGDKLRSAANGSKDIVILTNTVISPSTNKAIAKFKEAHGEQKVRVVSYDALSQNGIRIANERCFGKAILPDYDFSKAKVIVGVAADFLNNWLMNSQNEAQYVKTRRPDGEWMSRHYQFETNLSLTGSNADVRAGIKPSEEGRVLLALYNAISGNAANAVNTDGLPMDVIEKAARDLNAHRGNSLVVAGCNDPDLQVVVNAINELLGNYGKSINTNVELFIKNGNDSEVTQLIADMNAGKVGALLIYDTNPAYTLPNAAGFKEGLAKLDLSVSFASWQDETASLCNYVCPNHHYLESWNDFYPKTGHYALAQPTISPLYDTRQAQDSLLKWAGVEETYHEFMKNVWRTYAGDMGGSEILFEDFWFGALRNGTLNVNILPGEAMAFQADAFAEAASRIVRQGSTEGFEVVLYTKVGIGEGTQPVNPWLQELPDPISKITWDNYIAMNPADAEQYGFKLHYGQELPASVAKLTVSGKSVELPVIAQPGQKRGTVSVALGYGRGANQEEVGRAAFRTKTYGGHELDAEGNKIPIGVNVYPMVGNDKGVMLYHAEGATIEATGAEFPIASTQTHHTLMGRTSVVRETSLKTYRSGDIDAYNKPHKLVVHEGGSIIKKPIADIDLWNSHPVRGVGHRWGMSIDLTTCTGCSACVTACHSENNVPVVGKDEVRRGRDMHWLRIDRYYSSDMSMDKAEEEGLGTITAYREMEVPTYDNPSTVHMPMLCQHCNHAPCETVCPVAATTHSNEGLNQMTYNRCIGTRYCANNCPYKVRRFNWFNYKAYDKFTEVNPSQDEMARMVLNPDVTVRSRGVMEKCSLCVQRIQAGKLDAKIKSQPLSDGVVQTACAEACPTNAITFGDLNDDKSIVRADHSDDRAYFALEEVGAKPNISYKVKVRNV